MPLNILLLYIINSLAPDQTRECAREAHYCAAHNTRALSASRRQVITTIITACTCKSASRHLSLSDTARGGGVCWCQPSSHTLTRNKQMHSIYRLAPFVIKQRPHPWVPATKSIRRENDTRWHLSWCLNCATRQIDIYPRLVFFSLPAHTCVFAAFSFPPRNLYLFTHERPSVVVNARSWDITSRTMWEPQRYKIVRHTHTQSDSCAACLRPIT